LEFRSELYDAFNHPQFGDPDTEFTSPTFGQISSTVVNPRVVQLALKFSFRGHKSLLHDQLHLHGRGRALCAGDRDDVRALGVPGVCATPLL
jgi:hypothetical protein